MKPFVPLAVLTLLTAGCQSPHSNAPTASDAVTAIKPFAAQEIQVRRWQLIGTWYGDQPTKNGGRRQWITRRAIGGQFTIAFRLSDPIEGKLEQTEVGEWGVNGNYLVTVTRGYLKPDGTVLEDDSPDSYFWDVYKIRELTDDRLAYRSVETGNSYHTRKVPDDFAFPEEPNQASEPAPTSGTSAAKQPLMPAAFVAHL
jgi:hypothetical protein